MIPEMVMVKIIFTLMFIIFLCYLSYYRYLKLKRKMSKPMMKPYLQETFFVVITIISAFWYLNPSLKISIKCIASLIVVLIPVFPILTFKLLSKLGGQDYHLNRMD